MGRDAKALQEKAAKKAAQAESGGSNAGGGGGRNQIFGFVFGFQSLPMSFKLHDSVIALLAFVVTVYKSVIPEKHYPCFDKLEHLLGNEDDCLSMHLQVVI
ncbi:hypothetical protein CRYUN_Cryun14cG0135000 [Craigia yunnanensis]